MVKLKKKKKKSIYYFSLKWFCINQLHTKISIYKSYSKPESLIFHRTGKQYARVHQILNCPAYKLTTSALLKERLKKKPTQQTDLQLQLLSGPSRKHRVCTWMVGSHRAVVSTQLTPQTVTAGPGSTGQRRSTSKWYCWHW